MIYHNISTAAPNWFLYNQETQKKLAVILVIYPSVEQS